MPDPASTAMSVERQISGLLFCGEPLNVDYGLCVRHFVLSRHGLTTMVWCRGPCDTASTHFN